MKKIKESDYIVIVASIASFIIAFVSAAPAVALPHIAKEFMLTNIEQNWVINAFLFSVAIFTVPFGRLSGKYGVKKSFIIGTALFLIGSILTILSFSKFSLLLFRVFQGIGAALIYNTVTSIVVMAVPKNKRGRSLGLTIASVYIGLAIAPFIGGILTHHIGWRGIFEFSVPILLSVLLITLLKVKKEWKPFSEESFDKIGSILYGMGILLIIYGFTILNQLIGILIVIIGLIVMIIFIITERKIEYPILNISVFRNKKFVSSNLAAFISYLATFIVTYILNYHFQYIRGLNPEISGIILVVTPVVMAIVSPFSGYLSDKINPQKLAAIGMSFVTLALFILIFLNKSTPLYLIILAMFLQGLGFGIFSTPNTNTVMSSVPPKETPTASVAVTFMRVVGQSMSLAMLTVIFTIIMNNVPIIPKYYGLLILSSQTALIISTGLCLIAIIASVIGVKSKKINNIN